jgi:hypothetical protein
MQPMPFATPSRLLGLALVVAAATAAPVALAETGGPLPQGSTSDVIVAQQQPPAALPAAPDPAPEEQVAPAPQPADGDASGDYADTDPSALTDFREPLAPYGDWTQDPTYGTIWVPDSAQVGADFAPYQTAGNWALADSGDWMWQSNYAWGYIPFHYGRWVWTGASWGWIPGRRYAPAWVTWRVGEGGYLGWAPLPPTWGWGGGMAFGLGRVPYAAYCFVPSRYAFAGNVSGYVVRDRGMVQAVAATTRPYHAATPGVGSPSLSEAHIPASGAPHSHAAPDARATAFATRSSTAAAQRGRAASSNRSSGYSSRGANEVRPSYSGYSRSTRTQTLHTPLPSRGQVYSRGYPAYHSGAGYSGQHFAPQARAHTVPVPPASHPSTPRFSGGHSSGVHHR